MLFTNTIMALLAASSCVSAVNIRNYRSGVCNNNNYAQCTNIGQGTCCVRRNGAFFYSSRFSSVPPTALGNICSRAGSKKCGTVAQSGHGSSFCLGNGYTARSGSYWFDCRRSCSKKREIGTAGEIDVRSLDDSLEPATGEAEPDILAFDGHQFSVAGSTPAVAADALWSLFDAGTAYAAIPANLKQYELANPIGDN